MSVYRIYVEKKPEFAVEADSLLFTDSFDEPLPDEDDSLLFSDSSLLFGVSSDPSFVCISPLVS